MIYKINDKEMEKFSDFLSVRGKKILLYHNDPDGVCSAALILKFFPDFETIPRKGPALNDDFINELIGKKPSLVMFTDIPVDQEEKMVKKLKKETGCMIMIIDHHIYEKNLDSKEILHMNPRFKDKKAYIPTTCMLYRILEKMDKDVKSHSWIAAMGVIGDYAFEDCKELLDECEKEYPYLLKKHPLDSKLSKGADMISYAVIMRGFKGAGEALKVLMKSLDYEEFSKNKKLLKWKVEMEREFDFILMEARKEEYPEKGVMIYLIKTRFNITSLVATHFSESFPDMIIIVRKQTGDMWKLCLRNQSGRVNLGKVAKKAVKGIGSGGGHEKAAGVLTTDWEKFKKRFISYL